MEGTFKHFVVLPSTSDRKTAKTQAHTHTHTHYLFDCPEQPAIAVDHHQDRYTQAENEETDDVGMRLGRPSSPRYRATCSCPFNAIAAPAQ